MQENCKEFSNRDFCILLPRPCDKLDMTWGQDQWPGVYGKTGWNQCALLLEKSVPSTPWLLTFKSKDKPTVLSLWCFFFVFSSEGVFILIMKYCFNGFCLFSIGFFCKTASKQKKVHQKIFTGTNFMHIFPQVVPQQKCICQHSTQESGNIMTYAYMSTEHSRGNALTCINCIRYPFTIQKVTKCDRLCLW